MPSQVPEKLTTAYPNPNPSIFSEASYNRLFAQILIAENLQATEQIQTSVNSNAENKMPSQTEVKPWSEAQKNRKALVKAINGQFNIRLMNSTSRVVIEIAIIIRTQDVRHTQSHLVNKQTAQVVCEYGS